jgi:hypothetical protein
MVIRTVDFSQDFPSLDLTNVTIAGPNKLIVSGRFGLTGRLLLQPDPSDAYEHIAAKIRSVAGIAVSADGKSLYVGDDWTAPFRIARIDLTQSPPVIVSPDDTFSWHYPGYVALSTGGDRLYLDHGAVLNSTTLRQIGVVGDGRAYVEKNSPSLLVAVVDTSYYDPAQVRLVSYDAQTLEPTRILDTGCRASQSPQLYPAGDETRWLMLTADELCVVNLPD